MSYIHSQELLINCFKKEPSYEQSVIQFLLIVKRFQKNQKVIFPVPLKRELVAYLIPDKFDIQYLFELINEANLSHILRLIKTDFDTEKQAVIDILQNAADDVPLEKAIKYMFMQYFYMDRNLSDFTTKEDFQKKICLEKESTITIEKITNEEIKTLIVNLIKNYKEPPSKLKNLLQYCITSDFINAYDLIATDPISYQNQNYTSQRIHISDQSYKTLPNVISIYNYNINIYTLEINKTKIIALPNSIGELKKLGMINILNSPLMFIPNKIGACKKLKLICVKNSLLTNIPKEIGNCEELLVIMLENNKLSTIPKEICNCKKLQSIHLANNQISYLPIQLTELQNFKILDLSNNPLLGTFSKSYKGEKNVKEALFELKKAGFLK